MKHDQHSQNSVSKGGQPILFFDSISSRLTFPIKMCILHRVNGNPTPKTSLYSTSPHHHRHLITALLERKWGQHLRALFQIFFATTIIADTEIEKISHHNFNEVTIYDNGKTEKDYQIQEVSLEIQNCTINSLETMAFAGFN